MIVKSGKYIVVGEDKKSGKTLFLYSYDNTYIWNEHYPHENAYKTKLDAAKSAKHTLNEVNNMRIIEIITEIKTVVYLTNIQEAILELETQEVKDRLSYLESLKLCGKYMLMGT